MNRFLPLFLVLAACPVPEEPETKDTDTGVGDTDDTDVTETDTGPKEDTGGHSGDDWGGGCTYTATAIGAEDYVDVLGGTPTELAANLSGARSTTFHWDATGADTPLDHTLTVDASTAQLWTGVWHEGGGDTGDWESETGALPGGEDVGSDDTGGGTTADRGDTGVSYDTGAVGYEDTGSTGDTDTDIDTGGGSAGDTGSGHECASYVTLDATWTFATGDGAFAETLAVSVRAESLTLGRIDASQDYATLAGTYVPTDFDPATMDETRLDWGANIGVDVDEGEVSIFATRVYDDGDSGTPDVAEAIMGDVGRWPAP